MHSSLRLQLLALALCTACAAEVPTENDAGATDAGALGDGAALDAGSSGDAGRAVADDAARADAPMGCGISSDCDDRDRCTYDACQASHVCAHLPDPECGGCADIDADGFIGTHCFPAGPDCDDHARDVHPGATEICDNGIDDDCNAAIDDLDLACLSVNTTCATATALALGASLHGAIASVDAPTCGTSLFHTFAIAALSDVRVHVHFPEIIPGPFDSPSHVESSVVVERTCGDRSTAIAGSAGTCSLWLAGDRDYDLDLRRLAAGTYAIEITARDTAFHIHPVSIPLDVVVTATPSPMPVCSGAALVEGATTRGTTRGALDVFGSCDGRVFTPPDTTHPFELTETRRVRLFASPDPVAGSVSAVQLAVRSSCDPDAPSVACGSGPGGSAGICPGVLETILGPGSYLATVQGDAGPIDYAVTFATEPVGSACVGAAVISATGSYAGTTVGAPDEFRWGDTCGAGGDVVYSLAVAVRSRVVLDLISAGPNPILRVISGCGATRVAGYDFRTHIDQTLDAGTYEVVVDGAGRLSDAAFSLNATILPR